MSGGLGASCQLKILNRLLIQQGRRRHNWSEPDRNGRKRELGCDEAILFLAEIQDVAGSGGAGSTTDLALGFGQGVTRRHRAADESKVKELEAARSLAAENISFLKERRARLRWHWALEMVTTGNYKVPRKKRLPLWLWRSAVMHHNGSPALLRCGWRPTREFARRLSFAWAKENSLLVKEIPQEITRELVAAAVSRSSGETISHREVVMSEENESKWSAYVIMPNTASVKSVLTQANTGRGILLDDDVSSRAIASLVTEAREVYERAVAKNNVSAL